MSSDRKPMYKPHQVPKVCGNCAHIQRYYESPTGYRCTISHERIQDQNITPESTCDRWSANYWWLRRNVRYCDCNRNMTNCPDCRKRKEDNELVFNLFIVFLAWLTMVVCMFWAVTSK